MIHNAIELMWDEEARLEGKEENAGEIVGIPISAFVGGRECVDLGQGPSTADVCTEWGWGDPLLGWAKRI